MHFEATQLVKAPREKVFEAWTDFEAMPKYSTVFTKATVTKRQGNTVYTESEGKFMRRKLKSSEKHVLMPPAKVEDEVDAEGSKASSVTKFDVVPEGTRITSVNDIELKGKWAKLLGPFAKRSLQGVFRKEMRAFAKYVETQR